MATKHTHKRQNYNRKELAEKLEHLSDRVAQRGIYISRKNDYGSWDLYDYAKDRIVFDNLPNKDIAERVALRYNKNRRYGIERLNKINNLCNSIIKYNTDCIYYLHAMQNTKDADRAQYTLARLQQAKDRISESMYELNSIV